MEFYYDAFNDLGTDRQIGFGHGPIPYSSIINYCDRLELDYEEERDFVYLIRSMDNVFLRYQDKKAKKK